MTLAGLLSLFGWIPLERAGELTFWSTGFLVACAPSLLLCGLGLSKRWARFTDAPHVFALVYALPFFLLTFQDSLGDSVQMLEAIHARYHMSEPGATWVHYWLFRLLHEPCNVGAKFVIGLSSRLGGLAYLWFVARISLRLFPEHSASSRLGFRLIFFTAGVTLLFYGYIENTPLALPAEEAWVLASLAFLQVPSLFNLVTCGAALALATAFHGRVAFLAPAFFIACWIPAGSLWTRLRRAVVGGSVYVGLLAAMVAYILLIDYRYITGGAYGNVFGGGNGQMFVPAAMLLERWHWLPLVESLFIAGGILGPCALFPAITAAFKRDPVLLWALAYLLCDLGYLFFWEFDFGVVVDWDLVFSAAGPVMLLASIAVMRSRVPIFLLLPFLWASVIMGMAYAAIINGRPLALNVVPRADSPAPPSVCAHAGLRRTYFADAALSMPLGTSEADLPAHVYGPEGLPIPTPGKPFGGAFEGYLNIPSAGRYRFEMLGQGNLRLSVAHHTLYERWTGFEWQITTEREIRFPEAGWYPLRLEFFTKSTGFFLQLALESADQERKKIQMDQLCYGAAAEPRKKITADSTD